MEYIKLNKYLCKIISSYLEYTPEFLHSLAYKNDRNIDITKYSLLDVMIELCKIGYSGIDLFDSYKIDKWIESELNKYEHIIEKRCFGHRYYLCLKNSERFYHVTLREVNIILAIKPIL